MLEATALWNLVDKRAATTPDREMSVDESGRRITFAAYRDAALRAAAGCAALGVGQGDAVSWMLPTWHESLILAAALSRLGAVQNPIIPIYREREVGFIARQAQPKVLLVPRTWRNFDYEAMARTVSDANNGAPHVVVVDRALPDGDPATLPAYEEPGDDVRWFFYTSGTTADPKGAKHTDNDLIVTARGMVERLGFSENDRNALAFPVTHIAGPIWIASALLVGGASILIETFDPQQTPAVLQRENVTMAGSGTIFHMAYLTAQRAHPGGKLFPNLRNCPGGGAPKPPQVHSDIKNELGGVGILSGWGLTEAPILTMASYDDPDEKLAHTEGRAMPGVELRVVTIDGDEVGAGTEGELRAKAPQLMSGYVDSTLDKEAFDDQGFFRTGDLGIVDEDGYVRITGRLKDVIIRKGENISAKEVEDLLFGHPNITDVAVIGLPDATAGEIACAVIVAKDSQPSLPELGEFLVSKGLRKQALPERLEIVDALPRNPAGKVLKQDLKKRYQ